MAGDSLRKRNLASNKYADDSDTSSITSKDSVVKLKKEVSNCNHDQLLDCLFIEMDTITP